MAGRSPSPGKDKRIDSPTPATDPDRGKPTTVAGISHNSKVKVSYFQCFYIAMGVICTLQLVVSKTIRCDECELL